MSGVFLSYRRDDTAGDAQRIHERLADRFGDDLVYIDVEDIPLGVDFLEHITEALREASYVLVAIGPRWLLVTDDEGRQRLEDPEDPVRYEIRTAFESGRLVVPMLIGGAAMPRERDLPEEISALVRHNGIAIRPDPDFETDVQALMDGLRLEEIDESRVPTVFRVGLVARHLGYGGAVGWGILGAVAGLLMIPDRGVAALLVMTVVGLASGWVGGLLVGYLTGVLIREKAPPLVARTVRRMGVAWSLGLTFTVIAATAGGLFLASRAVDDLFDSADGLGELLGAALGAVVLAAMIVAVMISLGLVVGSSLAAAYFARKLRMRSEQITRWRALAIAVVWLLGGVLTGAAFVAGLAVPELLLEAG